MTYRVVYASNGAKIGDGIRIMRVSEDGKKLEILTNPVTGRFSEIELKPEAPAGDFSPDFSPDFR
jgi:hypothetical protein